MKFFLIAFVIVGALVGASVQDCSAAFRAALLAKSNELRAKHGSAPLSYDSAIDSWAQDWANTIAAKGKGCWVLGVLFHQKPY